MIESTLIARSTSVIAAPRGCGDAVGDGQDADDAGLHDAEPGRRERHGRQQRADQGDEERAADPELDVREAQRLDDEVQAHRLGRPDQAGQHDQPGQRPQSDGRPKTPSSKRS